MKTERRHELQHNSLAELMTDVGENAKPYAKAVLGILLAAVVVFGTYLYLSKRSDAEEGASWDRTWQALGNSDPVKQSEELRAAADKYPDKQAGLWAQLALADMELNRGVAELFTERSDGRNQIRTALEDYQAVEKRASQPMLRQHAMYGIGRAQESLGKIGEAREAYEALLKNYPSGPYSRGPSSGSRRSPASPRRIGTTGLKPRSRRPTYSARARERASRGQGRGGRFPVPVHGQIEQADRTEWNGNKAG